MYVCLMNVYRSVCVITVHSSLLACVCVCVCGGVNSCFPPGSPPPHTHTTLCWFRLGRRGAGAESHLRPLNRSLERGVPTSGIQETTSRAKVLTADGNKTASSTPPSSLKFTSVKYCFLFLSTLEKSVEMSATFGQQYVQTQMRLCVYVEIFFCLISFFSLWLGGTNAHFHWTLNTDQGSETATYLEHLISSYLQLPMFGKL